MNKILQHLQSEWYKYILEILVITFGILGAFALNNWHEGRKDKRLLVNHLTKISENLSNDSMQLHELQQNRKEAVDQIADLIKILDTKEQVDPQFFSTVFLNIVVEKRFIPNQNGFDELTESEAFERVTNSPFHDLLFEYIRLSDELIFLEERNNLFSEDMESELWKSGFYKKAWPDISSYTKHASYKKKNPVDYAMEFSTNAPLQGLILRSEFVFKKLSGDYQRLIEKGRELEAAIQHLIQENR